MQMEWAGYGAQNKDMDPTYLNGIWWGIRVNYFNGLHMAIVPALCTDVSSYRLFSSPVFGWHSTWHIQDSGCHLVKPVRRHLTQRNGLVHLG